VICVASVSNGGKPVEVYPSNIQPVIGVGATTDDDYRASFSNYGDDVDVAAPGVRVASTYPQNRYAYGTGTSFSTPYVAGTVALMRSVNYKETAQDAAGDLNSGAPRVKSKEMDAPRLDAYEAVKNAQ
jgi:subtilisin family serine protease